MQTLSETESGMGADMTFRSFVGVAVRLFDSRRSCL